MTSRSKSTLFLIEQIIVIAVFAICAAACVSIMTAAYFYSDDSSATSNAIIKAESAAEVFKATGGNVVDMSDILGGAAEVHVEGRNGVSSATFYYNNSWQISDKSNASYVLRVASAWVARTSDNYIPTVAIITVERANGEVLIAFPVAARMESVVMRNE